MTPYLCAAAAVALQVFCIHTEPNFSLPWQRKRQYSSSSSGFMITGRRILTNAHCVDHHTQVGAAAAEAPAAAPAGPAVAAAPAASEAFAAKCSWVNGNSSSRAQLRRCCQEWQQHITWLRNCRICVCEIFTPCRVLSTACHLVLLQGFGQQWSNPWVFLHASVTHQPVHAVLLLAIICLLSATSGSNMCTSVLHCGC